MFFSALQITYVMHVLTPFLIIYVMHTFLLILPHHFKCRSFNIARPEEHKPRLQSASVASSSRLRLDQQEPLGCQGRFQTRDPCKWVAVNTIKKQVLHCTSSVELQLQLLCIRHSKSRKHHTIVNSHQKLMSPPNLHLSAKLSQAIHKQLLKTMSI